MKNVIFIIVAVLVSMQDYAQNSGSKSTFIMPVFVDSATFERDVKVSRAFQELYNELLTDNDHLTYKYQFCLSSSGKVIGKNFDDDTSFKYINRFIENCFNKYKWKPAHLKGCEKCKRTAYGMLYVNLVPVNHIIQLQILMSDGIIGNDVRSSIIYDKRISFDINYDNLGTCCRWTGM